MPNQSNFTPEQIAEILELFFENMAHRQYIGARYVPIFGRKDETSIVWDNTAPYEPLTIVLYEGNSYTSRQYVPAGIEITNDLFWAETGNYNAQVEQYRQEVLNISGEIGDVTDDIDALNNAIGTGFSAQNTIASAIDSINTAIDGIEDSIGTGFSAQNTIASNVDDVKTAIASNVDDVKKAIARKIVSADDYGAIGDGQTDCTVAIQTAIDENPNSCITFKGGVYLISDTIFLKGDINSVSLDLNGSIIRWSGNSDNWQEGNAVTLIPNHMGISATPSVMIAVENDDDYDRDRTENLNFGKTTIANGTIDCDQKASIAIQNVIFITETVNLRVINFNYVGILNGTIDGGTYNAQGVKTSEFGRSTQMFISDCYLTRKGNMAADENTSCIMITYPDNQIDNCIMNHAHHGITLRIGGNSVSNTHITGEYKYWDRPTAEYYVSNGVRLWPYSETATEINIFDNMYFNAVKRAFYAYKSSSQSINLAAFRTICSNSHYTFYSTGTWFDTMFYGAFFGGLWDGIVHIIDCAILIGNNCSIMLHEHSHTPSMFFAISNEQNIINVSAPHTNSYMWSGENYKTDEIVSITNSQQPLNANKYKKVGCLVTTVPISTNKIPGTVEFTLTHENGAVYKHGLIGYYSGDYQTTLTDVYGTTGLELYISNDERKFTFNGVDYYYADLFITASSNVTDTRFIKVNPHSPYVDFYSFAQGQNYTSGTNQTVFDSMSNITKVF